MKRTGQKSFLTIFFILAAALTITGWFQAQTTSGSQTQDILEQSVIAESQNQESNTRNFIKQSLGISAAQASGETARKSGRQEDGDQYRYWLCKGNEQVPDREDVRFMTSSITQEKMQQWLDQIHGEQNQWVRAVGEQQCAEVGYRTPMDSPDNDNFVSGITIDNLEVSHVNGSVVRSAVTPNISARVRYNRFWYVYNVTKDYIQNDSAQNMKDSVREALRNVSDKAQKVNRGCGGASCPEMGDIWREDHPQLLTDAVSRGIRQELDKLENHEAYFNGNEVNCDFEYKEKAHGDETVQYPTWRFIPTTEEPTCEKETVGGCGTCQQPCPTSYSSDDSTTRRVDTREDPPGGGGGGGGGCPNGCWSDNRVEGTSAMAFHWDVWADIKVTCTDQKFNSVPQEDDLENLTWRFDMSFKVEERSIDNPFVCGEDANCIHAEQKRPWELRQCEVSDDGQQAAVCDSGVNTIEQTR